MSVSLGKVYLVGAGPGDPQLLTLRGAECLRAADVVLYDYLASAELLEIARHGAQLICLGRHGRGRLMSQDEVNEAIIAHVREGRTVVRLKGGDAMIFARLAEELAALEAAGVPYEIVPGITAAQAASSHAGIPLTDRDEASCVAFVTGQESSDKQSAAPLDYAALASFPGTIVFYMGITTAGQWSSALIEHGKPPDTPVAIVRRASLPDQQTHFTTLGALTDVVRTANLRPPAVVIVGDVARQRSLANWFTSRPMFGLTVLVTRPTHQADEMAKAFRDLGARVMCQPAIEITEPSDRNAVDSVIRRLDEFVWLVFSSANGVHCFLRRLVELGHDMRRLGGRKLAAIGPATVEALAEYHLRADVQPSEYRAEALAEMLAPLARGQRVFLARASRGRETLAEMLAAAGATIEQAVVYESCDVAQPDNDVADTLAAGRIDWTTVTSSAIARSLVRLFGASLNQTKLAAISPLTAEVLTELGHAPAVVADDYTTAGVVAAVLAAESRKV
ncbi:MAG TPA: uroporphyrinogen-III C-methyltransferase [Lacipirellulaceae bacterium]